MLKVELSIFYADMKDESIGKKMEKELIIDFLNEHWDDFLALMKEMPVSESGMLSTGRFPAQIYEFAGLLSKIIAAYQRQNQKAQVHHSPRSDEQSAHWITKTGETDLPHTRVNGLLGKAQYLRSYYLNGERSPHPIIFKNGLFVVQPQQNCEKLDAAFKTLVDSVL